MNPTNSMDYRETGNVIMLILHTILAARGLVLDGFLEETNFYGVVFPRCVDPIQAEYLMRAFSTVKSVLKSEQSIEVDLQLFNRLDPGLIIEHWTITASTSTLTVSEIIPTIQTLINDVTAAAGIAVVLDNLTSRVCIKLHPGLGEPSQVDRMRTFPDGSSQIVIDSSGTTMPAVRPVGKARLFEFKMVSNIRMMMYYQ